MTDVERDGKRVPMIPPRLKKLLKTLVIATAALQLTVCAKTVQWAEEVLLNTGETILVKRTDTYSRGGEPGNPLAMSWGIGKREYAFSWKGKKYTYQAKRAFDGAMLIYADIADNSIAIVDTALNCETMGYGEFRWRAGSWQLQHNVSKALVDQPRNLMSSFASQDGEPSSI